MKSNNRSLRLNRIIILCFFCYIAITMVPRSSIAESFIILEPGKALGEAQIGQDITSLQKAGFEVDEAYASNIEFKYFKKNKLRVRCAQNRVVEIWHEGPLSFLKYKSRRLPNTKKVAVLKKFFKHCEVDQDGSGGSLTYCLNRGVLLAFNKTTNSVSVSVVTDLR